MNTEDRRGPMAARARTSARRRLASGSPMGMSTATTASGPDAAAALETLLPMDVLGLGLNQQRYGLLLADDGGILDDLMFVNRGDHLWLVLNGACKAADLAYLQARLGQRCAIDALPEQALLALQGPLAATALQRLLPGIEKMVFMQGAALPWQGHALYATRSGFVTQCEAQGFRRITWFLDRPDNLAVYTVTVRADRKKYPVLLSNGNLVASGDDWAQFEDPFPKPSYLFALVAADL